MTMRTLPKPVGWKVQDRSLLANVMEERLGLKEDVVRQQWTSDQAYGIFCDGSFKLSWGHLSPAKQVFKLRTFRLGAA